MREESLIIKALIDYKKSDTCVLLGCGRSINNITDKQWTSLQRHDLWAVNNWVYHPSIVPDFYHIEAKHYDYALMKRRLYEKRDLYKDVKFIFPIGKTIKQENGVRLPLKDVVFEDSIIFEYGMQSRDSKRTHKVFNAHYKFHMAIITKSYDMSMTAIIEMIYRLGYHRIVMFGIELNNSYYFWTGNDPKYGEVHHQSNKSHEGKNPDEPHATHRILHFILDFNSRWMQPEGKEICIGHRDTVLNEYLRYLKPEEL